MIDELEALEARIEQVVALVHQLRADNEVLRNQMAAAEAQRLHLRQTMNAAREGGGLQLTGAGLTSNSRAAGARIGLRSADRDGACSAATHRPGRPRWQVLVPVHTGYRA